MPVPRCRRVHVSCIRSHTYTHRRGGRSDRGGVALPSSVLVNRRFPIAVRLPPMDGGACVHRDTCVGQCTTGEVYRTECECMNRIRLGGSFPTFVSRDGDCTSTSSFSKNEKKEIADPRGSGRRLSHLFRLWGISNRHQEDEVSTP